MTERHHPRGEETFINGVGTRGDPYGESKIRSPPNTTHSSRWIRSLTVNNESLIHLEENLGEYFYDLRVRNDFFFLMNFLLIITCIKKSAHHTCPGR